MTKPVDNVKMVTTALITSAAENDHAKHVIYFLNSIIIPVFCLLQMYNNIDRMQARRRTSGANEAMFKIIMIGDSGTGKSCLLTRYTKD